MTSFLGLLCITWNKQEKQLKFWDFDVYQQIHSDSVAASFRLSM